MHSAGEALLDGQTERRIMAVMDSKFKKLLQAERNKLADKIKKDIIELSKLDEALTALTGQTLETPTIKTVKKSKMDAKARKAIGAAKKKWWAERKKAGKK